MKTVFIDVQLAIGFDGDSPNINCIILDGGKVEEIHVTSEDELFELSPEQESICKNVFDSFKTHADFLNSKVNS